MKGKVVLRDGKVVIRGGRAFHYDTMEWMSHRDGRLKGVFITRNIGTVYFPMHCIRDVYEGDDLLWRRKRGMS